MKTHTCPQQAVDIYVHRFKMEIKAKMAENFRNKYNTVYNSVKKRIFFLKIKEVCGMLSHMHMSCGSDT